MCRYRVEPWVPQNAGNVPYAASKLRPTPTIPKHKSKTMARSIRRTPERWGWVLPMALNHLPDCLHTTHGQDERQVREEMRRKRPRLAPAPSRQRELTNWRRGGVGEGEPHGATARISPS